MFNMDHPAFAGDQPIGLSQMKTIMQRYKAAEVPVRIVAVFHGQAGYMMLNDAAYDKARKSEKGNPFKEPNQGAAGGGRAVRAMREHRQEQWLGECRSAAPASR